MTDTVQISATQVNDLRSRTGVGLMECKRALVETKGDVEAAIDLLRKKGLASAAKKADRSTNEGLVATYVNADQTKGGIVMVGCETDFVAKTDDFKAFAKAMAEYVAAHNITSAETLLTQTYQGTTVKDALSGLIAKLGENMSLRSPAVYTGSYVEHYIHIGGKVGVLLCLNTANAATAKNPAIKTLAKDVCMHIAASSPMVVSRDQVDPTLVAKEKEIAAEQAKGKPPIAAEKIIAGKLEKYYAQSCLLEQPFVKNPDMTITALLEATSKQVGDTVTVKAFSRLQVSA